MKLLITYYCLLLTIMTLTQQIAKNTFIQAIGRAIGIVLGIITIGLMTRYLGQVGFGEYTTVIAFLQFFSIIADLGLYLVATSELGRVPDEKKFLSNVFTLRLASAIFFLILVSALVWIFPYSQMVKIGAMVASLSIFFSLLGQILTSVFQKHLAMGRVATAEIIGKVVLLIFVVLAIFWQLNLLAIFLAVVLGGLANFLTLYFYSRRYSVFGLAFDFGLWREILRQGWPIATSSLFIIIYFKADTLILSLFRSEAEVGIYGAAYKILEVLLAFPAMFMGLVLPVLSRVWAEKNPERFSQVFHKAFDFMMIIAWPMVLGGMVLARPIMNFVAGSDFTVAAPVLSLLLIATGVIFISHVSGYAIVALGKQRAMMPYYIWASILSLIAYIIFIPRYSYYGAAGVTIAVETFVFLAGLLLVLRETKIKINFLVSIKSFLAGLVMAVILYFIRELQILLLVLIGGAIYFSFLYLIGGVTKERVLEVMRLS